MKAHHLARYKDIAALLVKHSGAGDLKDADPEDRAASAVAEDARKLGDDLESSGPTFIKLGQLLSTRSDLLPPLYLEALTRLQDDCAPVPFDDIEEIVTTEVGAPIGRAFSLERVLATGDSAIVAIMRANAALTPDTQPTAPCTRA